MVRRNTTRDAKGRFAEGDLPPSRKVLVSLQEPFIQCLDDYGKEHGCGRGHSIQRLLDDVLAPAPPPKPIPAATKDAVALVGVKKTDPLYKHFREKHYIPDQGIVGQSLQYLIFYDGNPVGIIGGSSAVYANEARDTFFGLSEEKELKTVQLNSIINNNVFKLDYPAPNLATIVLKKWRRTISTDWQELYGVAVAGFETFVIEERLWSGKTRNGACYRADNWTLTGISKGYGNSNMRGRTTASKSLKEKKLVYCKKIKGIPLCKEYKTSWHNKEMQYQLEQKRNIMIDAPLDAVLQGIRSEH